MTSSTVIRLHEPVDAVYHGHGHKVVFLKIYGHLVDGRIGPDGDRICLHDVLYFRDGGMGDHLFQGKDAPELAVVVSDVDVVDVVEFLGLWRISFRQSGIERFSLTTIISVPIMPLGGVFVILEKVDDVACLLDVFDVRITSSRPSSSSSWMRSTASSVSSRSMKWPICSGNPSLRGAFCGLPRRAPSARRPSSPCRR